MTMGCVEPSYFGEDLLEGEEWMGEVYRDDRGCEQAKEHSDFGWVLENVLIPGCTGSAACHEGTNDQEDFNLIDDGVYEVLLGASEQRPDLVHVVPGDPANSYLMIKFGVYGPADMEQEVMPPPPAPMLCTEKIDALRRWIEQGARDN